MIISRTPKRISFFGGGTDYPVWFRENKGMVLSTTINKYSYITLRYLPQFFEYKYRIRYFKTEQTQTVEEIKHPSVRECAKFLGIDKGFEIVHNSDLPAASGLGSSSCFTVGLLNAFYALNNYMPTKFELAQNAITVEQEFIKESVGSQDQVACAWGGFNKITFAENTLDVDPILIEPGRLKELEESLLLCFTGFARSAPEIAKFQIAETKNKTKEIETISEISHQAFEVLKSPTSPVSEFGRLLTEHWKIKRNLTDKITNSDINLIYETGMKNGAIGGKLLGAGGGGFMLFYAPKELHSRIKGELGEKMFVPFKFDDSGSKVIYYSKDS
jgi:D-glycero-alpha-D-manno-heptose-7-phosphate kinase